MALIKDRLIKQVKIWSSYQDLVFMYSKSLFALRHMLVCDFVTLLSRKEASVRVSDGT
jgi:hypothetical protein